MVVITISHQPSAISHQPSAISHQLSALTRFSEAISLQPAIQRAAAETERLRRLTHVSVEASHRFLDQKALDLFEAHVFDARRLIAIDPQPQLAETDERA